MRNPDNSSGDERGASLLSIARELEDARRAGDFEDDAAQRHRANRRLNAVLSGGSPGAQTPPQGGSLLSAVYSEPAADQPVDARYARPLWAGPEPGSEPSEDAIYGAGVEAVSWSEPTADVSWNARWQDAPFATTETAALQSDGQYASTDAGWRARAAAAESEDADAARPLIDPRIIGARLWRSKLLITTTTLAGALIGYALTLNNADTYTATAQVRISSQDFQVAQDLPQAAAERSAIDSQALIITSAPVLAQAVEKTGLANDPEFNGKRSRSLDLVALAEGLLFRADAPSGEQTENRAVKALSERVKVERIGQSYVFNVAVSTESPATSVNVANEIANAYVEQASGAKPAATAVAAAPGELEKRKRDLQQAEAAIEAFRAENGIFGPLGETSAETELARLNDQLAEARARQIDIKTRAQSAKNANVDMIVTGSLPDGVTSNALPELRVQYSAARQALDSAAVKLGPRHPQLQALQAQLEGAQDQLKAELRGIVAAQQGELRRSVELEQDLSRRLSQLKAQLGGAGQDMLKLRDLEREAEARRVAYEALLPRAAQADEVRKPAAGDARLIAAATTPSEPAGSSRVMTIGRYSAGGFLTGLGLALLLGVIDSVKAASQSRRRRAGQGAMAGHAAAYQDNSTTEAPSEGDMYANHPSYPYRDEHRDQSAYAPQRSYAHPSYAQPEYTQPAYVQPVWPSPQQAYPEPAYEPAPAPYGRGWEPPFDPHAQPDPYGQASHMPSAYAPASHPQPNYPQPVPAQHWRAPEPAYAPHYAEPPRSRYPAPAYPQQQAPAYAPPRAQVYAPHQQVAHPYPQPDPYQPHPADYGYQANGWEPSLDDWRRAAHQALQAPQTYPVQTYPAQSYPSSPQSAPNAVAAAMSDSIAELRATLRECREAMMHMAAQDARRRY